MITTTDFAGPDPKYTASTLNLRTEINQRHRRAIIQEYQHKTHEAAPSTTNPHDNAQLQHSQAEDSATLRSGSRAPQGLGGEDCALAATILENSSASKPADNTESRTKHNMEEEKTIATPPTAHQAGPAATETGTTESPSQSGLISADLKLQLFLVLLCAILPVSYVIAIVCAIAVYRQNAAQRQDTFKLPANEEQNPVYQTETAEWLNLFLSRVWCMLSPSMLTGVADMLEDALLQSMPSIMTAVQIEDFQLGPKAPIISDVKVYPGPTLDTVVLECGIFLKPSSPDNQKEGFHMILNAFVGIPQVGKVAIPIMVQEAGFHGKLRMKLTLVSDPPFLSFGQFQFISPPKVGVGILPLRMVNVMDLPWLSGYIKAAIDAAIGSVMVEPNARIESNTAPDW